MFENIKNIAKAGFDTPVPLGKVILVTGAIVLTSFLLTHKVKLVIILT